LVDGKVSSNARRCSHKKKKKKSKRNRELAKGGRVLLRSDIKRVRGCALPLSAVVNMRNTGVKVGGPVYAHLISGSKAAFCSSERKLFMYFNSDTKGSGLIGN
jgi:hypothetical protein